MITPLLVLALASFATAQPHILDRPITFECHQQPIGRVLETIATTGNFYFSYSGALFNKDSLITLPKQTRSVRQLLDLLFHGHLQYLEDGRYLILLPAANKTTQTTLEDRRYLISGTILDQRTGQPLGNVSIYDPATLSATMSKKDGSFSVRIKNDHWPIILAVSKESYIDTIIQIRQSTGRDMTITISPDAFPPKALLLSSRQYAQNDSIHIEWQDDSIDAGAKKNLVPGVETMGFARIVLSYRLRIQSINLKKWFVTRPVQISLIPGLSTNGSLNSQVTNNFSANLIGGYSSGLKGVELGGVFNIERKSVTGIQAAGVVNIAGDSVKGIQLAGIANKDLDSASGLQAAGVANTAKQIKGVQLAGVINQAGKVQGFQAAGVLNKTHYLKGVQLGVINIADTSEGLSIGLINIVHHGIHELSFYADEWSPLNIAFRSGTPKLYSVLFAGMNPDHDRRSYYYGYGLGHLFPISQHLTLQPELTVMQLSPVNWRNFDKGAFLARFNLDLHWRPTKNFGLSAGPSFTLYNPQKDYYIDNHPYEPLPHGYSTFHFAHSDATAWIGWRVAVNLF